MFRGRLVPKGLASSFMAASFLLAGCTESQPTSNYPDPEAMQQEVASEYTPQISPRFTEPWPTQITRQEMIETALYKGFQYFDTLPTNECEYKPDVFIGESIIPEHEDLVRDISVRMATIFCDYLSDDFTVIAGGYEFVSEVVKEEGLPSDEFGGVCGYAISPGNDAGRACAVLGVAWVGKGIGTMRMGKVITDEKAVSVVAHEIFHVVHDAMDPGPASQSPPPGHPFYRPVWFIEGGGEFFGSLIPKYLGLQEYGTFTPTDRLGAVLKVDYLSDLAGLELRATGGGPENYYSGQVALEYITASVGMESLLDVWVQMGQGREFEEAFENALGISIPKFYERFAVMHSNLYSGDLAE